ncbi:MAG: HYR domain-containing protein [Blastocatellia bacterium]
MRNLRTILILFALFSLALLSLSHIMPISQADGNNGNMREKKRRPKAAPRPSPNRVEEVGARAERERLKGQEANEVWQHAIRAYPNGIPGDARIKAMGVIAKQEAELKARANPSSFGLGAIAASGKAASGAGSDILGDTWFPIGPAPIIDGQTYGGGRVDVSGRTSSITVNPMNPNDVWLGTANGGVWHSVNGGVNWGPMSDNEASLSIGSIALADCATGGCARIYAGTGENAIRRDTYYGVGLLIGSTSGGEFSTFGWALRRGGTAADPEAALFNYASINKVLLDPTTSGAGRRIFVALSSGVTASASESTVTAPQPPQGYGVFRSDNDGLHWTKLSLPGTAAGDRATDLEMDPQDHNTIFAGVLGKGVYRTTDNGATWCPLNPGIPLPGGCAASTGLPNPAALAFDHVELAIHRPNPGSQAVVYAVLGRCADHIRANCEPGIFKSADGGATWTQTNPGNPVAQGSSSSCVRSYSRYTHGLAIDPANSNTIVMGALRVCKSINSGMSFTDLGTGSVHPDHRDVVFPDPSNSNRLYDSSDGGFAYSNDGGASWNSGNSDLQVTGFQSISSSPLTGRIIGGTQDNGTNLWLGSRVWKHIADGDSAATLMDLDDVNKLYDLYVEVAPRRSIGGALGSFQSITSGLGADPSAFYPPMSQDPLGAHPLYFGTNRLYKTDNDGTNWTPVSPVLGGTGVIFPDINQPNVITAIGVHGSRIYVGYYDGKIFSTTAACTISACWTQGTGLPAAVATRIAVDPGNSAIAYAAYSGFNIGAHVYKTTNGGVSWSASSGGGSGGLPDIPANTISIEPSSPSVLWLGTDMGVYKSTNGGASWTRFNKGLPNVAVYEISIDEEHRRVYAGTHGRGVFVITSPLVSNFEGWVDDQIWDIPVYGHGFLPNQASCQIQIIRKDGTVCAMGTVDAIGGTVGTDSTGQLVTTRGGFYNGLPVAWACLNGNCVGGTNISACNSASNPITTVLVRCGADVGVDKVLGCPQQNNPPSGTLGLGNLPGPGPGPTSFVFDRDAFARTAAAGAFDIFATVQVRDGSTRALCSAPVAFQSGENAEAVLERARDALNASPACAARGVTALVYNPAPDRAEEDLPQRDSRLSLSAPTVSGSFLFPALHALPGAANSQCFEFGGIGNPLSNGLLIMKLKLETGQGGAMGGSLTLRESSPVGTCDITIPTMAGDTAAAIAARIESAFQAPGDPGPHPRCFSRHNPRDIIRDGDSIITVVPVQMNVCVNDAGLGIFIGPEETVNQISDLRINQTASPATVVTGADVTYNITVTNMGTGAAGNVTVIDNLPPAVTFVSCAAPGGSCGGTGNNRTASFASLAPNASATVTIVARVNCANANDASIANVVSATHAGFDPDLANNAATVATRISNPPPSIICPANVTAMTASAGDAVAVVNYPAPTVMDNCPGVTVVCSKPSGSVFPAGVTAVTCTATDSGGAAASCSFTVTVFDVCLQDDNSRDVLLFNSLTGDYQFTRCGSSGFTITGRGMISRTPCLTSLRDARVTATLDRCLIAPQHRGAAAIRVNPVAPPFEIVDSDTRNNTCGCP